MGTGARWLAAIALVALAACDRSSEPAPDATTSTTAPAPSEVASAIAEPEPQASAATATPSPEPSASPAEASFAPRDDCAKLPGWPAFHEQLASAVAARDVEAFAALSAPDIKLDYGGGSGTGELRERLGGDKPGLWAELDRIMPLGCAVEGGLVAMPWYFWHLPDDIDAATAMLVTGTGVPLRARPSVKGAVVQTLDWAMVEILPGKYDAKAHFLSVTTRAGKHGGYAESAKLRSVLAYRLIAERKDGEWKLTAFIAGD